MQDRIDWQPVRPRPGSTEKLIGWSPSRISLSRRMQPRAHASQARRRRRKFPHAFSLAGISFTCAQPGFALLAGNQSQRKCIPRAWLLHKQVTNHTLKNLPDPSIQHMESATAGGAVVAVSVPQYVDEGEPEDDRVVDLCVAEVNATAAALQKLMMRVEGRDEVFQQWGLPDPEDEPQEESSLVEKMQRGVSIGRPPVNRELPSDLILPICYRGPPSFDLAQESTVPPGRHTAAPAALLDLSANILSIKVLDSSVGFPIDLYGSVFVRDDLDLKRVYLFNRDRHNAQTLTSPEEALVLTGPSRGLVLINNLFFNFNLKLRRDDQQVNDIDFGQGKLEFDNRLAHKPMLAMDELTTEASTIGIAYSLVDRAVEATIQISVPEEFTIPSDELYGKISAFATRTAKEVVLFDSEACGTVIKIVDGGIKLWRHVLSLPIHGSLLLRVATWEGDSKAKMRSSSVMFTPQICGKDFACIDGPMRIKVTWSPIYIPKYDDKLHLGILGEY